MPLTPNAANHVRRIYRRVFQGRTSPIELMFADKTTRTIAGIWKWMDTADPRYGPGATSAVTPAAQSADAAFETLTEDVSLAELAAVISVRPSGYEGAVPSGAGGRYLIVEVQPRGIAWPPERAFVRLRRA